MGKLCPSFEALSAYHDGEAAPTEGLLVTRHLPTCAECRATLDAFRSLAGALTATAEVPCGVARQFLSADLDGELSTAEHAIAARHLVGCAACGALRAEWMGVDVALRALPVAYPSPAADAFIRGLVAQHGQRRVPAPRYGRAFGSVAVIAATVALVVFSAGQRGGGGPLVGVGITPQNGAVVASAQQIFNPINGMLYILEPPKPAVLVRSSATQELVKTITVGGAPTYMTLSTETKTLYVLDPAARAYTAIDTERNVITERVPIAVTGTPTSIEVDTQTGKLVITSAPAASLASPGPATLSIIDPTSKKLEITKQVEVSPTKIVVDRDANRIFLIGTDAVSVLDARTYEKVDTLPLGAVAIAVSANGGAGAILVQQGGRAILSFYRVPGGASFPGSAAGLISLPDGGFAVLIDERDGARIILVNADGGLRGSSFTFSGSARQLSFDAVDRRFITADGRTIATLSGSLIAAATTAPASQPPATSAPAASTAPSAPPTSSARPAGPTPLVVVPSTPAPELFPGAVLSAVGVYRYDLASNTSVVAMATGAGGRLWLASRDGSIGTIDPPSGTLSIVRRLGSVAIARLAFGNDRVFALDATGNLYVLNVLDQRLGGASVPFGSSVRAMSVALDGRLWLVSDSYNGLMAFDPRTSQFEIVYLDAGARPTALGIDTAGRIWFADSARSMLGTYEPSAGRVSYMNIPGNERVTALFADAQSSVWLGTASGAVYRESAGAVQLVSRLGGAVLSFAKSASGSAVVLIDAGASTLVGTAGGELTVASGAIRSMAVDGSGHIWLGDPSRAVLYIVEPRP